MPTILIVEDEAIIRALSVEILADAGYDVLEADDAGRAIEILECHRDIDLLFTDIRMPGAMDGLELAGIVSHTRPSIRLLLTSGHTSLAETDLPNGGEFIPKPYGYEQLKACITRLLLPN